MDNREKHQLELVPIAYIRTEFPEKFGIPRQSGLADTKGIIMFEPEYQNADAVKGVEEYSHLWLIWGFSGNPSEVDERNGGKQFRAMVRPPRLGGNKRVGVWATRSPFRPNPVGLSCVKIERIEYDEKYGPLIYVEGVDMMDGTPIYDIKPYLPYVDCKPEATGSFSEEKKNYRLEVRIPEMYLNQILEGKRKSLIQILSQDPRPSYHKDSERIYGMEYAGMSIHFQVEEQILYVKEIIWNL